MKKFILSAIAIILFLTAFSQSGFFYVHGRVIDKNSKAPMQSASVFAQYTTVGTPTDAQGNFTLQLPSGGYDLNSNFSL